jgi:hypothetical protein
MPFMYIDITNLKNPLVNLKRQQHDDSIQYYRIEFCLKSQNDDSAKTECESDDFVLKGNNKSIFSYEPNYSGWFFFRVFLIDSKCSFDCPSVTSVEVYIGWLINFMNITVIVIALIF